MTRQAEKYAVDLFARVMRRHGIDPEAPDALEQFARLPLPRERAALRAARASTPAEPLRFRHGSGV
jgi:hypothetical protein